MSESGDAEVEDDESGDEHVGRLHRLLGAPFEDEPGAGATYWPEVPAADLRQRFVALRGWVDGLKARFSHLDAHAVPRCWWRHNGHVEALSALFDYERASFSLGAPASSAIEFLRALRDVEAMLRAWTAELACGAAHEERPARRVDDRAEWEAFVAAEVERRFREALEAAAQVDGVRPNDRDA